MKLKLNSKLQFNLLFETKIPLKKFLMSAGIELGYPRLPVCSADHSATRPIFPKQLIILYQSKRGRRSLSSSLAEGNQDTKRFLRTWKNRHAEAVKLNHFKSIFEICRCQCQHGNFKFSSFTSSTFSLSKFPTKKPEGNQLCYEWKIGLLVTNRA